MGLAICPSMPAESALSQSLNSVRLMHIKGIKALMPENAKTHALPDALFVYSRVVYLRLY